MAGADAGDRAVRAAAWAVAILHYPGRFCAGAAADAPVGRHGDYRPDRDGGDCPGDSGVEVADDRAGRLAEHAAQGCTDCEVQRGGVRLAGRGATGGRASAGARVPTLRLRRRAGPALVAESRGGVSRAASRGGIRADRLSVAAEPSGDRHWEREQVDPGHRGWRICPNRWA